MSNISIEFLDYQNQLPTYINAFFLYEEGGSIVCNCGFIDRLPETVDSVTEEEDKLLTQAKTMGRFVMSHATALGLLNTLKGILDNVEEIGDNDDNTNE